MNIITDKLPSCVTADGVKYKVNTDFRVWIKFQKLACGEMNVDTAAKILKLCYAKGTTLPPTLKGALDALCEFYCCNSPSCNKGTALQKPRTEVFSYDYDSEYIYAAFMRQYRIDLADTPYLHWFKYCAMLKSLADDEKIIKIIGYRQADVSKIKDKSRQSAILRLKRLYALPQNDEDCDIHEQIAKLF